MATGGAAAGPTLILPSWQSLWEWPSEMASLGLLFKTFSHKSSSSVPKEPGLFPTPTTMFSPTFPLEKDQENALGCFCGFGFVVVCFVLY